VLKHVFVRSESDDNNPFSAIKKKKEVISKVLDALYALQRKHSASSLFYNNRLILTIEHLTSLQTLMFFEHINVPRSITIYYRTRKWNNKSFVV
jgi:hypothetical protein